MTTRDENCTKCGHVTTWTIGPKYTTCQGCKGKFPCSHQCSHYDCREARQEVAVDENGVYREFNDMALVREAASTP